uniref:Uncharacterized protein n=1 Tax=Anguilla anguilla TaxID=7936 RepID=A0A0E9UZW5_ANGAN
MILVIWAFLFLFDFTSALHNHKVTFKFTSHQEKPD